MSDDFDYEDTEELFNEDYDDEAGGIGGGPNSLCPTCETPLHFKIDGRAKLRYCKTCDFKRYE